MMSLPSLDSLTNALKTFARSSFCLNLALESLSGFNLWSCWWIAGRKFGFYEAFALGQYVDAPFLVVWAPMVCLVIGLVCLGLIHSQGQ
jgi:hypothetical protein